MRHILAVLDCNSVKYFSTNFANFGLRLNWCVRILSLTRQFNRSPKLAKLVENELVSFHKCCIIPCRDLKSGFKMAVGPCKFLQWSTRSSVWDSRPNIRDVRRVIFGMRLLELSIVYSLTFAFIFANFVQMWFWLRKNVADASIEKYRTSKFDFVIPWCKTKP